MLQPPKEAPVVPHAPASHGRLCCRRGLTAPTIPTAGQAIPPLHSLTPPVILRRRQRSRTSEPSYSSPRGLPLPRLPRLRVVPFLGLVVVHTTALVLLARRGQRGQRPTSIGRVLYVERLTARSTAAARKCLLITRKIIIPPPDSRDLPDGPPVFHEKMFAPDCWDPPDGLPYFMKKCSACCQLRPTGSASLLCTKNEYSPS